MKKEEKRRRNLRPYLPHITGQTHVKVGNRFLPEVHAVVRDKVAIGPTDSGVRRAFFAKPVRVCKWKRLVSRRLLTADWDFVAYCTIRHLTLRYHLGHPTPSDEDANH